MSRFFYWFLAVLGVIGATPPSWARPIMDLVPADSLVVYAAKPYGRLFPTTRPDGQPTLFAALEMAEGRLIGECMSRHRHQEWIKFLQRIDAHTPADLDLHLIVDNYSTHKHARVKSWLMRHPRFHIHFTPTSSSWLNMVERWFRDLTDKCIRRGSFDNVTELTASIMDYIAEHNANPRSFTWTANAETILEKVRRARATLENVKLNEALH